LFVNLTKRFCRTSKVVKCFGTEFQELASIFGPWNGVSRFFLFRGMVRNGIPRVCFYFCYAERNSEHFALPRNGSELNAESLLLPLFHCTEFRTIFTSTEWFGTELRGFSIPRNSRNSAGTNEWFHLFRLRRNNFLSEIANPSNP
jgi:hypothetical protein